MKKQLIVFLLPALILASCQYEDGPNLSLRSKKARAVNTWYIDKVYEEGVDVTDNFKSTFVDYKLELKSDDNYALFWRLYNVTDYNENGTWDFSDDKAKITWTKSGSSGTSGEYKILRLKHSELWVTTVSNNKSYEYHFKD